MAEICLRQITNTEIALPKTSKRLAEGLQLKQQLGQLLKTLNANVSIKL